MPVDLSAGRPVRITATHEETTIASQRPDGTFALVNGRTVAAHALWPLELEGALLERLAVGDLDDVDDFVTRMNILHLLGAARGRRPGIVSRRPRPALSAPALRRRAGQRHRSGALVARRRSGSRKDHRGVADPEPARPHRQGDALPGGGARHADRAVAGRAVAEVSPGVHAPRLGSPRRCGARFRRRLQPLRAASPHGDLDRDADRAAGVDGAGGARRHRPAGGR